MTINQIVSSLCKQHLQNLPKNRAIEIAIGNLSHADRRTIQQLIGATPAPANLFYDYDLQKWI